jgi:parallel beta-helix repeat protein
MATFYRTDGWVKSVLGQAIAGAQIFVCLQPVDASFLPPIPLATVFSDPAGLSPVTQPIITDGFGHYDFYAASGIPYTIVVVNQGKLQQIYADQVPMGATLGSSGGGAVSSVFGRTGSIVAQVGDYGVFYDPLGAAAAAVVGLAPLNNPSFTGTIQIVNASITGTLKDGTGVVGTPGQLLSSTGTGTAWVTGGGGGSGTVANGTKGQIGLYASNGTTISGFSSSTFYPETYGAVGDGITNDATAIQNTINAAVAAGGGTVQFGAKTYLINSGLSIITSSVNLQGVTCGSSILKTNSASIDMITVAGSGTFPTSGLIYFNKISDLGLTRSVSPTGTAKGISLSLTDTAQIYRVQVSDSVYCFYHSGNGNALTEYQQCQANFTTVTTTGTVYGWYIDGGNFGSFSGRNLDSVVINFTSGATTIYGMYMTGAFVADLYCEGFETSLCHYGVFIEALTSGDTNFGESAYNNDNIHFVRCVHDNCKTAAYYIHNLYGANSYVEITGGYVVPFTGASTPLVQIENSAGVVITGMQIRLGGNAIATNPGIYINGVNSKNNVVNGNIFYVQNAGTPIVVNSSNRNVINNNAIYGYAGAPFAIGIKLTGSSFNTIDGNAISGTGTTGISLDATSNNNGGVNVVDTTAVGAALSDSGTGNFVTVAGSGGGSSDFVKITEVVVGSAVPTVTFSSIPATYRNLKLVVTGRTSAGGTDFSATFNGDVGANYQAVLVFNGSGAGASTGFSQTSVAIGSTASSAAPANQAGVSEIMIYDYSGTTFFKSVTGMTHRLDGVATAYIIWYAATWNSTAAINAIALAAGAGNFVTGSVFTLYGLK